MGAVAVPSSLAMAELAGLPVVYGLYGTFLPLAVYALLGTSRQHVIGPDSTLAALTAVTVAPMAMVGGGDRPGALCGARSGAGAGDGSPALPGGRAPAGVRGGLLRQAGAARLHQRGRADRDLVPARQAPRDQRRRGRLLRHRVGGLVGARRRERADRAPQRGAAGGGNRDSAHPSCPPAVSRGARARTRDRGARRPGGSRRSPSSARSRAGCPRSRCQESEQATSSISCFPRRHSRSSPSRTSSRPCAPSRRSTATRSTPTVS